MGRYYTIIKNDTLSAIANREGVASYHVLYDAVGPDGQKNRDRLRSGSPHLIYVGEVIWIPTGKNAGRRKKKCRRFCSGVSPVRITLGGDGVIKPAENIAAIYVPTKWGGKLKVEAVRVSDGTPVGVRLYYRDGTLSNRPKSEELRKGTDKLGDFGQPFVYDVPRDRKGWFFAEVAGQDDAKVENEFLQEHALSRTPWNSWYWPHADRADPNLYDWTVTYSNPPGGPDDGPLVKYDKYTGAYSDLEVLGVTIWRTSPARDFEWNKYGDGVTSGLPGHCDATAWAGFEESRPSGRKPVVSSSGKPMSLTEQDRLGLCTERYWVTWGGERNHDIAAFNRAVSRGVVLHNKFVKRGATNLDAMWFHNKLRERIADDTGGIQIHDLRNWNYGIFQYRANIVGYGTSDAQIKKVKVRTRLTYVNWGVASSSAYRKWHGGPNRHIDTVYRLLYKDDGTIARQLDWPRDAIKGGVSKKITAVWYANPDAPIINEKLNKLTLKSLYI